MAQNVVNGLGVNIETMEMLNAKSERRLVNTIEQPEWHARGYTLPDGTVPEGMPTPDDVVEEPAAPESLGDYKVAQLKQYASENDFEVSGKKAEIVEQLEDAGVMAEDLAEFFVEDED